MRKKFQLIVGLLMLIILIVAAGKLSNYVSSSKVTGREVQIVLDAGHGGRDPGKVGNGGNLEKDINLAIVKKVEANLKKEGIKLLVIRKDDNGLYSESASNKKADDMRKRVGIINDSKALLAVSIHQNSFSDQSVMGPQVFYFKNSAKSKQVAEKIQNNLNELDPDNARSPKTNDTYYMLLKTEIPTVIVECGFLSSPTDEERLTDEEYQEKMAKILCDSIIESLALLEP